MADESLPRCSRCRTNQQAMPSALSLRTSPVLGTSAALIVEPIQGFDGGLRPPDGYLEAISKAASDTKTFVILDEIQTLRFAYSGLQQTLGLTLISQSSAS